jgi:hypothetical protein
LVLKLTVVVLVTFVATLLLFCDCTASGPKHELTAPLKAEFVNASFVAAAALKVAVIAGELAMTLKAQGLVVEAQPVKELAPLHPPKAEPALGFAVNVPVASLSLKLIDVQVLVNVHDVTLLFVPP